MQSIIEGDTPHKCYRCGIYGPTERHHIFGGANRKHSEWYGLTVELCHYCHNEPPHGAHHCKDTAMRLKRIGQAAAMNRYGWTESDFRAIFGKNYL